MGTWMNRREALMSAGLLGVAMANRAGAGASASIQAEEYTPALGDPKGLAVGTVDPADVRINVSSDRLVATTQFGQDLNALVVELGDSGAYSATRTASVSLPVTPPPTRDDEVKKFFGYQAVLRGDVQKDRDTRVVLLADLGGEIHTVEFPYGEERSEGIEERLFAFLDSDSLVTVTEETVIIDGREVIQQTRKTDYVKAPSQFTAVITLSVQRRSPEAVARASIGEFEVGIIQPKPPTVGDGTPAGGGDPPRTNPKRSKD